VLIGVHNLFFLEFRDLEIQVKSKNLFCPSTLYSRHNPLPGAGIGNDSAVTGDGIYTHHRR
jgi:hypothetical protein